METKQSILESTPRDLREIMSRTANSASVERRMGQTMTIDESIERDKKIIQDLEDAIKNKEEELENLENEKKDLKDFESGN